MTTRNARVAQARQETEAARSQVQADADQAHTSLAALQAKEAATESAVKQDSAQVDALTGQLAAAQRDLAAVRADAARARDAAAASARERDARIAQIQQESTAVNARLRFAQSTLDQIAAAARLINGSPSLPIPAAAAPAAGTAATAAPPAAGSAPAAASEPGRTHIVQDGDSLTRISTRYYGTPNRWQDIYDANRDVLQGQNTLQPGQRLKIP